MTGLFHLDREHVARRVFADDEDRPDGQVPSFEHTVQIDERNTLVLGPPEPDVLAVKGVLSTEVVEEEIAFEVIVVVTVVGCPHAQRELEQCGFEDALLRDDRYTLAVEVEPSRQDLPRQDLTVDRDLLA